MLKCRNLQAQICTAVACRRKSTGHAFKMNDTCANICDLHVGYAVQITSIAIVLRYLLVSAICMWKILQTNGPLTKYVHRFTCLFHKYVQNCQCDKVRCHEMSSESENNALRIPNHGIYGGEWLTSCFNASAPRTSLRYPLDTRLRSFLDQFGRGSRHSNISVSTVDPRLPLRVQSLYCVRQAE
jgi:hypothetical protein